MHNVASRRSIRFQYKDGVIGGPFRDLVPATTFITCNVKYAQEFQACNGIPLSENEQTERYANDKLTITELTYQITWVLKVGRHLHQPYQFQGIFTTACKAMVKVWIRSLTWSNIVLED